MTLNYPKIMLVYQPSGIANVFAVDDFMAHPYIATGTHLSKRGAVRLFRCSPAPAIAFALACKTQGCEVRTAHSDKPGDIAMGHWSFDLSGLSEGLMNISSV